MRYWWVNQNQTHSQEVVVILRRESDGAWKIARAIAAVR